MLVAQLAEADGQLRALRQRTGLRLQRLAALETTEHVQRTQLGAYRERLDEFGATLGSSEAVLSSFDQRCATQEGEAALLRAEEQRLVAKADGAGARREAVQMQVPRPVPCSWGRPSRL